MFWNKAVCRSVAIKVDLVTCSHLWREEMNWTVLNEWQSLEMQINPLVFLTVISVMSKCVLSQVSSVQSLWCDSSPTRLLPCWPPLPQLVHANSSSHSVTVLQRMPVCLLSCMYAPSIHLPTPIPSPYTSPTISQPGFSTCLLVCARMCFVFKRKKKWYESDINYCFNFKCRQPFNFALYRDPPQEVGGWAWKDDWAGESLTGCLVDAEF